MTLKPHHSTGRSARVYSTGYGFSQKSWEIQGGELAGAVVAAVFPFRRSAIHC